MAEPFFNRFVLSRCVRDGHSCLRLARRQHLTAPIIMVPGSSKRFTTISASGAAAADLANIASQTRHNWRVIRGPGRQGTGPLFWPNMSRPIQRKRNWMALFSAMLGAAMLSISGGQAAQGVQGNIAFANGKPATQVFVQARSLERPAPRFRISGSSLMAPVITLGLCRPAASNSLLSIKEENWRHGR